MIMSLIIHYYCPNSKKEYSAYYFRYDKFCKCCNPAHRLLVVEENLKEEYWTDFAAFAD